MTECVTAKTVTDIGFLFLLKKVLAFFRNFIVHMKAIKPIFQQTELIKTD